jgi:hypothetical protein
MYYDRVNAVHKHDSGRVRASIIISKYWRRYIVLKVTKRIIETQRMAEEAEQEKIRVKEQAFLKKMKVKMSLLAL